MSTPQPTETSSTLVWVADPLHTQVEFAAKHLGMMTVRGYFSDVTVTGAIDPVHHDATSIAVSIQTASIRTHNDQRDNDLRASTFLEVDKYPTITFKSTQVEHKEGDRYMMTGDLTIKGITHPVPLNVVRYGEFNDDDGPPHQLRRRNQGQPQRLRHDLQRHARWPLGGQRRDPDPHRRRACRAGSRVGARARIRHDRT
jgi:polyisoprenoid-binding protein YceI